MPSAHEIQAWVYHDWNNARIRNGSNNCKIIAATMAIMLAMGIKLASCNHDEHANCKFLLAAAGIKSCGGLPFHFIML